MTRDEIMRAVLDGLAEVAPEHDVSRVGGDVRLRDALDIDSYDFLTFLVGLHARLGVEIPEADYGRVSTLDQLLHYLEAEVARRV